MIHHASNLSNLPQFRHGFFEKSAPQKPSLNAATTDHETPEEIQSQREFMMHALTGQTVPLMLLKQIHSPTVHIVDSADQVLKEGDGLVTKEKNIALGILTADCGPILFADPENGVIGAAHAGWRGALAGVIESTVAKMETLGAERSRIIAALGPTIQPSHYEVGPEFEELLSHNATMFLRPSEKKAHFYFDLPLYIQTKIKEAHIENFEDLKLNTFTGNFFSRREALHKSQSVNYGGPCNLSAILIRHAPSK